MCLSGLPGAVLDGAVGETGTRDLLTASPALKLHKAAQLLAVWIEFCAQESSASPSRGTPDYGKFYKTAYMELKDGYKRAPSINADVSDRIPLHFHRPGNRNFPDAFTTRLAFDGRGKPGGIPAVTDLCLPSAFYRANLRTPYF